MSGAPEFGIPPVDAGIHPMFALPARAGRRLPLGACVALLSCLALAGIGRAAGFEGLGSVGGGGDNAHAAGVSGDGEVVVGGCYLGSSCSEAWRWTQPSGLVALGFLPGDVESEATGASFDGSVVSGSSQSALFIRRAARWVDPSGWQDLSGDLPAHEVSWANAVSSDGSKVVGGYIKLSPAVDTAAFLWETAGATLYLQTGISLRTSDMSDISDAGVMSGNENLNFMVLDATGYRITEPGALLPIPALPLRSYSNSAAISADGSSIVGRSDWEAYRWTGGGGSVGLGTLFPAAPSPFSHATDVSQDGTVVVGWSSMCCQNDPTPPPPEQAFIWTLGGGMQNLEMFLGDLGIGFAGWTLTDATGISHDGRVIVGNGINPTGTREPWRAELPSEVTELPALSGPIAPLLPFVALLYLGLRALRRDGRLGR